jgi:simple sugar transport system ATP-binding protein
MDEQRDCLVRMRGITKRFGHIEALKDINLTLSPNEVLGLVGDNGAGKSTTVKILAGVYPPDEGELIFQGKRVRWSDPREARAAGIEIVYQDLGLIQTMDLSRNFFLGKEPSKGFMRFLDLKRMREEAIKGVKEIGIEVRDPDELVCTYSGGQQKALAIARAVYFGVKLLILDEPTAALSIAEQSIVLDLVKEIRNRGIGIIFITHNIYHAFEVADKFVVLAGGKELLQAKKDEITPDILRDTIVGEKARPARSAADMGD